MKCFLYPTNFCYWNCKNSKTQKCIITVIQKQKRYIKEDFQYKNAISKIPYCNSEDSINE